MKKPPQIGQERQTLTPDIYRASRTGQPIGTQTYSKITISYVDDVTICAAAGGESLESLTTEEMENLKEKLHCHEMGFAIDKTKT